ncbi:MAG TPA: glycosyltransferase family 2 protein [Nocardioides sp.]|nr:glycosyltransferase family 2 protein [Nocardioides sp.]
MDSTVVVVPMYNESAVVGEVLARVRSSFDRVVCVDDGSADGSDAIARATGATVLRHAVNLGQGAALQTGFDWVLASTRATHVVTFDADGQYSVDDALAMVDLAQRTGVDIVLGSRNLGRTDGQPLARRVLMRAALGFSRRSTGLALTDTHNGLRVLNRKALLAMSLRQRGMAHASEIESRISSAGLSWVEHPITMTYTDYTRRKGQSNVNAFNVVFDLAAERIGAVL